MEVKEDGEGRQKEAMCMWGRGGSVKEADVRGASMVHGARVVRAWCERGASREVFCIVYVTSARELLKNYFAGTFSKRT